MTPIELLKQEADEAGTYDTCRGTGEIDGPHGCKGANCGATGDQPHSVECLYEYALARLGLADTDALRVLFWDAHNALVWNEKADCYEVPNRGNNLGVTASTAVGKLDQEEVAFLAARVRRLCAQFDHPVPSGSDWFVVQVAGTLIGAVLAKVGGVRPAAPDLLDALKKARDALQRANCCTPSIIVDTIWMPGGSETLFDFIDSALEAAQAPKSGG